MKVLHAFECETETIFLSVTIMDLFINVVKTLISKNDVLLICSISIYIASKMEDVLPINMKILVEGILHDKHPL